MDGSSSRPLDRPAQFNFATDVFDGWAQQCPNDLALWWVDAATGAERRFTFAELARSSRQAANLFRWGGVGRGDRVLLLLPRLPQWWIAMLGLTRLGAVPVPATPMLTARDVGYRLEAAGVRAVVTSADNASKAEGFDGTRWLIGGGLPGWTDFEAELARANTNFTTEPTAADDPALLYFTSATTGEPKMVLHSQASYGLAHRVTGELWLDLRPGDVHWNLSDPGWAKAAWSSFFGPWHQGACVFALDTSGRFDPVRTLETLAKYPITTWCAPPTAMRLIVREPLERYRFPQLRHCVTAGEPLNPEVLECWREATGLTLYEAYGQTETIVLVGNFRALGKPVRPGSMGMPTPGMGVVLLDDQQQEIADDREGEIALRVAPDRPLGLFREYWNHPEEMARQFRNGYYLTGDRARRDAEGYFWFVGRADDVIKSSGYRIGPFEVESALLEHEAVLDVAVVGKADELRGQIVKAYVVLRPGFAPGDLLAADLKQHCKRIIAPYKYPREIEFVGHLPKTTSGKIRRGQLRSQS